MTIQAVNQINKEQLLMRKKAWEDIKLRLEYSGRHTKKDIKIFESYYLRGAQPKLEPSYKDPIPLIYRLWLCSDQSDESWESVVEQLLAGPPAWRTDIPIEPTEGHDGESWREECQGEGWGWQIKKSLEDSFTLLTEEANSSRYDGVHAVVGSLILPPLGFMGGVEKRLADFLPKNKKLIEYLAGKRLQIFDASKWFVYPNYMDICIWLDGRRPHSPCMLAYYLSEYWYAALSDDFLSELKNNVTGSFYLDCYLQLIARYPKPEAGNESSERHLYCQKLRDMLDNRPIPLALNELWLAAKSYKGLIDLNELDFKYPDTDHPDYQPEHYYVGDF